MTERDTQVRDRARDAYVADNGGELWEIPGDEAFEDGWDAHAATISMDAVSAAIGEAIDAWQPNLRTDFQDMAAAAVVSALTGDPYPGWNRRHLLGESETN